MGISFEMHFEGLDAIKDKLSENCTKAEHNLAQQIMKDTAPFVPASGNAAGLTNRTYVAGNSIIYPGPYARYLYYGKVMVNRKTLKGPMHFIDKFGNEQIAFPKGSKLIPTDRDLHFSKHFHRQAQSHWFEASKAQNMEKWLKMADEEVKNEL